MDLEPPLDLYQAYKPNCRNAELYAADLIFSVDVPVFNPLRNVSATNCYIALCRMKQSFGSHRRTFEHCLCLTMLTEYISCSYNHKTFYATFNKQKSDKFYELLFRKLHKEWRNMFQKLPMSEFTSISEFEYIANNLRTSINRFSTSFKFWWLLKEIRDLSNNYSSKFLRKSAAMEESNDTVSLTDSDSESNSQKNNDTELELAAANLVVTDQRDEKVSLKRPFGSISHYAKPLSEIKREKDKEQEPKVQSPISSRPAITDEAIPVTQTAQSVPVVKAVPVTPTGTSSVIKTVPVISKGSIVNFVKPLSEIQNQKSKEITQTGVASPSATVTIISTQSPSVLPSNKVNAFDILMKKSAMKKKSIC